MSRPDKYSKMSNLDKHLAIELNGKSYSYTAIAEMIGHPRKTVADFLNRETNQKWWANYDAADSLNKLGQIVKTTKAAQQYDMVKIASECLKKFLRPLAV